MAKPQGAAVRWIVAIAVLAGLGTVAWLALSGLGEPLQSLDDVSPAADGEAAAASYRAEDAAANRLRIAAGRRLSLDFDELPETAPLVLALDLSDEARGSGERTVRVVSADGRRLDTTASAISGPGAGLELRIAPGFFLSAGRYLVEVDTVEAHPLRLRRYVIELR